MAATRICSFLTLPVLRWAQISFPTIGEFVRDSFPYIATEEGA